MIRDALIAAFAARDLGADAPAQSVLPLRSKSFRASVSAEHPHLGRRTTVLILVTLVPYLRVRGRSSRGPPGPGAATAPTSLEPRQAVPPSDVTVSRWLDEGSPRIRNAMTPRIADQARDYGPVYSASRRRNTWPPGATK